MGDSPQERGRRGLGWGRSLDPPPPTHSNCGSDRASPGLQRCSASQQRTAPSLWCHRQTECKQVTDQTLLLLLFSGFFHWRFTDHVDKGRDENEDDAKYSDQGAVGARLDDLL